MNYSIIVIGDELLIGQVADTNSGWIARHLTPYGWHADTIQVIADDAQSIARAIDLGFERSDVILMTGGLGPTKDDITKSALCRYFGGEMIYDQATARNVAQVIDKRHLKLNEYTRLQAMVPSSCKVIQNRVGTAPLMWFERDGKVLVSMPGVPHETETMMQLEVIPRLMWHFCSDVNIVFRTLVCTGIIESALAMELDEFERALPPYIHLAYLPEPGVIRLRLGGSHSDKTQIESEMEHYVQRLHDIIGGYIICDEDKPLPAILGEWLLKKGLTVSTAESCTGGNIAHELTRISGSSQYFRGSVVSYASDVKVGVLGVSADTINEFTVVSEQVARQMADGACRLLHTDCAVATTGIAGPGGAMPGKPVGTVWIAAKCGGQIATALKSLPGNRERVINRATTEAQLLLLQLLMKH